MAFAAVHDDDVYRSGARSARPKHPRILLRRFLAFSTARQRVIGAMTVRFGNVGPFGSVCDANRTRRALSSGSGSCRLMRACFTHLRVPAGSGWRVAEGTSNKRVRPTQTTGHGSFSVGGSASEKVRKNASKCLSDMNFPHSRLTSWERFRLQSSDAKEHPDCADSVDADGRLCQLDAGQRSRPLG